MRCVHCQIILFENKSKLQAFYSKAELAGIRGCQSKPISKPNSGSAVCELADWPLHFDSYLRLLALQMVEGSLLKKRFTNLLSVNAVLSSMLHDPFPSHKNLYDIYLNFFLLLNVYLGRIQNLLYYAFKKDLNHISTLEKKLCRQRVNDLTRRDDVAQKS